MHVFKAALKSFFRHPLYLLIYVVWLSCMGVFMGMSVTDTASDDYLERPLTAVIDRDGGAIAAGVTDLVAGESDLVEVEDSEFALQDAVMQERAHYIAIIPEGFSDDYAAYVRGEGEAPQIETVLSTQTMMASMMDNLVNEYLSLYRTYAIALPDASQADLVDRATAAMAQSADVEVVQVSEAPAPSVGFLLFMQFSSYTILLSIAVCSAVVMSRFNRDELRRRNIAAPVSTLSFNLQVAAACCVIMLLIWAFVSVLGVAVFGGKLVSADPASVACAILSLLCYSLFGLAMGFLVGQVTRSEVLMNAIPNIVGLAISFLGGVWVSLDLVGEPIVTIAKFTPVYYYNEALKSAFATTGGGFTPEAFANMGTMLLFAVALFAVALALVRLRRGDASTRRARAAAAA